MNHPNADYYDKLAEVYDKATEPPGAWTPPEFIKAKLVDFVSLDSTILDIGIGTGRSIDAYYELGAREIVGIDCSAKMLEVCAAKYPEIELHDAFFPETSAVDGRKFDVIISSGVFEFIEDMGQTLRKCAGLMNPDSQLVFTYEPIIIGHEFQGERQSPVVPGASSFYVEGFNSYRHHSGEMNALLKKIGFNVHSDEEFISYKKAESEIVYHCIRASLSAGSLTPKVGGAP